MMQSWSVDVSRARAEKAKRARETPALRHEAQGLDVRETTDCPSEAEIPARASLPSREYDLTDWHAVDERIKAYPYPVKGAFSIVRRKATRGRLPFRVVWQR